MLAFRRSEPVVRFFMLGDVGFVATQGTAAVIFGRELLFDPRWGEVAIAVNRGSRLLSYWALVMMLWVHPRRLRPTVASAPIAVLFVLAWVGEVLQWWPRPNLATPAMATLTSLVAAPLLGAWQWRATRRDALDHAVANVMVLSFAVPTLLRTLTYQLPRLFGDAPSRRCPIRPPTPRLQGQRRCEQRAKSEAPCGLGSGANRFVAAHRLLR
jgi:hypothetical protein